MKWSNYLKIGLFFIGIGTAGTVYIVRSTDGFNDLNTKVYQVIIDDATGLTTNSKVYLAGVPVGKIQSITIKDDKAILKVAFLKNVELRQDAVIHRRASSILGTSILALSPGTELSPILKEGSTIEAAPSMADTSAIMNSVQDLSRQLNQILKEFQERQMALLAVSLETFNSIARKIDAQTEQQLERVSRILEASATISEQVERILAEREKDVTVSLTELRQSLENLRAITEEIRQGQGSIGKLLYDEELYNSLLATARETEAAAAKLEATIESIQTLANNTNTVVVDAGNLVSQVNRLEVQIDSQARYTIGGGAFQGGTAIQLIPRKRDRYYRIGVDSDPTGQRAALVSAEIGRKLGIVTLLGGLIENTAGLGFTVEPIQGIQIRTDLYNFQKEKLPNLRGTIMVYPLFDPHSDKFWNWIYLYGGIQNSLSSERDFFVGTGLRFTDEEIRSLVGLFSLAGQR